MIVTRGLVNAKISSDKLYGFIINYFLQTEKDSRSQARLDPNITVSFYQSLVKAPGLAANPELADTINSYI